MLTRLKRGMNSTRGNEGACPLVRSWTGSWPHGMGLLAAGGKND